MPLLIENVHHAYGPKVVLEEIDLTVLPGEVVCLLGPSGCGKTTLLRLIAGLEELQAGRISIDGQTVAEPDRQTLPEERGTGFLFQDFALFPHLTVIENTMFGLSTIRDKAQRRRRAIEALESVGMNESARAYPHELSGGQQQRVALARAMAPRPEIMLLDEPFSSLDARLRVQIRDQTLHVLKSSGVATVMVTHDPEEAMFMGDRIVLMNQGRIVQSGSPAELYARPINAFVATFFSDVNTISGCFVRKGMVETVFGAVPADGLPEGTRVNVMFRPDSVQITPRESNRPDHGIPGMVLATRLLPGAMLVHLRVPPEGESEKSIHLHARIPCILPIPESTPVSICVPDDLMYIFPSESP